MDYRAVHTGKLQAGSQRRVCNKALDFGVAAPRVEKDTCRAGGRFTIPFKDECTVVPRKVEITQHNSNFRLFLSVYAQAQVMFIT